MDQMSKKVVVRFVKISRFCLAEVTKRWPFESPEAANLLPVRTHEHEVIPHRGIACLGVFKWRHLFSNFCKTKFVKFSQSSLPLFCKSGPNVRPYFIKFPKKNILLPTKIISVVGHKTQEDSGKEELL